MDLLFKSAAGVLITVILYHVIPSQRKDLAMMLSIAVSCMVCVVAFSFLQPVVEFLYRLQDVAKVDDSFVNILVKVVGIALVTEVTNLLCNDFGNGGLGKTVHFLAIAATLFLSLPVFNELLDLLETVLMDV